MEAALPVVFIAEDDKIIANLLSDFLNEKNIRVVALQNGKELLAKVEEIQPDVLMIDVQMPGLNGIEVMERIRSNPDKKIAALPIIAVTALAIAGDRERCMAAGANLYLSKPVKLSVLPDLIRDLCKNNPSA
jgi:CheY-like chemotaxis protein